MAVVLGIDAAWTPTGSSGIALLDTGPPMRVLAAAPSYRLFIESADGRAVRWAREPGTLPYAGELLDAAHRRSEGRDVDLVAVDMPIARTGRVTARREADRRVSCVFGARKASVHSPTPERPGALSETLVRSFAEHGFDLVTCDVPLPRKALIEVYPLAAVTELLMLHERPMYKTAKAARYLPDPRTRLAKLLNTWLHIIGALRSEIEYLGFPVEEVLATASVGRLKPYEDALDAIVCAWVGACFLAGKAEPFGDDTAAIWIPCRVGIAIRPLREDDWRQLRDLRLRGLREESGMFHRAYADEAGLSDAEWRAMLLRPNARIFGAFDGERLVGITGAFTDRTDASGETAAFGMTYLAPPYRRRGVARRFHEVRLAWVREQPQFRRITVSHRASNAPSRRAIERQGFTHVGTSRRTWHDGVEDDELHYAMLLR